MYWVFAAFGKDYLYTDRQPRISLLDWKLCFCIAAMQSYEGNIFYLKNYLLLTSLVFWRLVLCLDPLQLLLKVLHLARIDRVHRQDVGDASLVYCSAGSPTLGPNIFLPWPFPPQLPLFSAFIPTFPPFALFLAHFFTAFPAIFLPTHPLPPPRSLATFAACFVFFLPPSFWPLPLLRHQNKQNHLGQKNHWVKKIIMSKNIGSTKKSLWEGGNTPMWVFR